LVSINLGSSPPFQDLGRCDLWLRSPEKSRGRSTIGFKKVVTQPLKENKTFNCKQ
jgi:hypothetical protein